MPSPAPRFQRACRRLALACACFALLLSSSCRWTSHHAGRPSSRIKDLQAVLTPGDREAAIVARTQTKTIEGMTVSAVILSDDEARRRYGKNLGKVGLQAVWLRAENKTSTEQWLLATNLDPNYFTADEAAHMFRPAFGGLGFEATQQQFRDLSMRARLEPGSTHEGHILIPRTEGGRYVEVEINGHGKERRFEFPLRTPDGHFDFESMDPGKALAGQPVPNLSMAQFRQRLAKLPATATDAKGSGLGDPLNFVLVGSPEQTMAAPSQCDWSFTHRIDSKTVRRLIAATLRGRAYANAPISPLYVYGRSQDLSFQRARTNISQRNHMRLWHAPFTVEGQRVWIGQVSRDIGIKLTDKSKTLTTHVIDPAVDEARQFLFESLMLRYRVKSFAFVSASAPSNYKQPGSNLTGDPYYTDGMRLVVFLADAPVKTEDVRDLGWGKTTTGPIEFIQSKRH